MMVRLLADENFNNDIIRGLRLRDPEFDVIRVQDVGLLHAGDRVVLEWAGANNRIVLTHDKATMPDYAYERVIADAPMPGIFVLSDRLPIGEAIEELLLVSACSAQDEWSHRVVRLPL